MRGNLPKEIAKMAMTIAAGRRMRFIGNRFLSNRGGERLSFLHVIII
jgi:hypothetical protein